MSKVTGAQLAAKALEQKGIDYIFTLSGGHITPLYQYLQDTDIKLFDTRHEQAAVFMAEAWARMNRKPGIAMVTAGPGFTNALTGVANARQANTPMVLISGCVGVSFDEKLDLQDMRQAPVIEPMVKKVFVCHNPDRVPEFIDMAYREAMTGRPGPVYLELPVDILNAQVEESSVKYLDTIVNSCVVDTAKAEQLMDLIAEAKKPAIFAGSGAWYSGAEESLKTFVEKTGIPVLTGTMGRGVISDEHPLCFEDARGTRPGASLMAQCDTDLVILLGSRLSLFYLFGTFFSNTKIVQVDIEGSELGRNKSVDLPIVSDINGLMVHLNKLVDERGVAAQWKERHIPWIEALQANDQMMKTMQGPNWDNEAAPIHPMRLAKEVNNFLNREDDIVVADGGDTQIWMGMTRTVQQGGHYLDSGLYGCLGVGIPYANAAKLNYPDKRVLLIIGDGATGFNFMEFETALRHKLPVVVVISNDLGWGMIRHSQQLRMGEAIATGTWIGEVPYHKMVEALGGFGVQVDKPEDINAALEAAFASGLPACINVMTDPSTISPGSIALANVGAYT